MVPIGVIADMVCDEIGDRARKKKMLILQYIALGFQQMHFYLNQTSSIKSIIISPGEIKELPCDFVYETKVGLKKCDRIVTIKQKNDTVRSFVRMNDTMVTDEVNGCLCGDREIEDEVYFYNVYCGGKYNASLTAYGRGYDNSYYSIQGGQIHISSCMPDDAEIIIEYVSDGLSDGLKLVPSEAYLCLHAWAHARLRKEGTNGENQLMYESQWKTLKRLYNRKSVSILSELFTY